MDSIFLSVYLTIISRLSDSWASAKWEHTKYTVEYLGCTLIAQTGLQFDLSTPQGRLVASIMAALAEFEPGLIRERIRSGIAAAHVRGVKSGKRPGQRVKAERLPPKVLQLVSEGHSYRFIAKELHLGKNTVNAIVKRHKQSLKDFFYIEKGKIFLQRVRVQNFSGSVAAGDSEATFPPKRGWLLRQHTSISPSCTTFYSRLVQ